MSCGFGAIRGGKKQKAKSDAQWDHWKGNRGLKMMMKEGFKPGMGLGDGRGRSGQEWGLNGEWVDKSSPQALNALTMAFLLSPPTSSPPLYVPPPPLFTKPHGFSLSPPIPSNCRPPRDTNTMPTHTFRYSSDLVFIPAKLRKGWGRRFPVELPDR